MTSRFDRLGIIDRGMLVLLIVATSSLFLPMSAAAQTSNQKPIVFEIKTLQIPNTTDIANMLDGKGDTTNTTISQSPTPPPVQLAVKTATKTYSYNLPPKATGDARVYMHEPQIRAYICPKIGDVNKCNIFMAVLAAENGTHECTRDNRGLNRNGSVDIGLAQINWTPSSSYSFEQLQDCKFNLDVALSMYARRGFQPWYAYTKGAYLSHLPAILASANIVAEVEPVPTVQ